MARPASTKTPYLKSTTIVEPANDMAKLFFPLIIKKISLMKETSKKLYAQIFL